MNTVMIEKLDAMTARHAEVTAQLGNPEVIADQEKYRELSRERARLEEAVERYREYQDCRRHLSETSEMLRDSDTEVQALARGENEELKRKLEAIELEIRRCLLPRDPHDRGNLFLEIRAGTGGDEAAIFAGDLFRMYHRYAEAKGWRVKVINSNEGEHGGFKEIISRVIGEGVYSMLKFESGVHRVQRIPETESQGRIHTSAATVAVLPEADEVDDIELDSADLRIDKFRASGAGGQHVNKTDSAVRVTHAPSGLVAECQDERSQHRNKARALALLKARLLDLERRRQARAQAETRKNMVGSGDRSQRIRTYNFPQGRVTDHRINLTLHRLPEIISGDLDPLIEQLVHEHQATQLAQFDE